MAESAGDKDIKATQHKRDKAKRDGNLPRSKDFVTLISFILAIIFLFAFGAVGVQNIGALVSDHLKIVGTTHISWDVVYNIVWGLVNRVALIVTPYFVYLIVTGLIISLLFQGGWVWTFKPFKFQASKFNMIKGLKKIMGNAESYVTLVRSILIVLIVIYMTVDSLGQIFPQLFNMSMEPLDQSLKFIFDFIFAQLFKLSLLFFVLAIADMAWTKYSYEKKLKMTKEEFKDEKKNLEGDPRIKNRIRSVQLQMHRQRMMASVPRADVVVTNPIHYAVAIQYNPEKSAAPTVLAKGGGYVAEKIKSVAKENEIPIVENPPLAQTLMKTCEVGDMVPPSLYKVVAEVLAYVYKLKGKMPA